MKFKDLFLKNHNYLSYLLHKNTQSKNDMLPYDFLLLLSAYFNKLPHKRHFIDLNVNKLLDKNIDLCIKAIKTSKDFQNLKKENNIDLSILEIDLKKYLEYRVKKTVNIFNKWAFNNFYMDFNCLYDDITSNDLISFSYLDIIEFFQFSKYNNTQLKTYYDLIYNSRLFNKNLYLNIIITYKYFTHMNDGYDIELTCYQLYDVITKIRLLINKPNNIKDDENGVIIITKVGKNIYLDKNGNIEIFDKNNINKYLNYEVIEEQKKQNGKYKIISILCDFI